MTKQHILEEIKRTAKNNDGVPVGSRRFFTETGIKYSDWCGVHWARWNDAVREAGFTPNQKKEAYDEEWLIVKLIALARVLGHFPTKAELRMKSRNDEQFPSDKPFRRFGPKNQLVGKVADYCKEHPSCEDVLAMCDAAFDPEVDLLEDNSVEAGKLGFVYLLKSGGHFKIGKSNASGRRERELQIQLPEKANIIHQITTDDPAGIENYWHKRFEGQRKNGEWFVLSAVRFPRISGQGAENLRKKSRYVHEYKEDLRC